MSQFGRTQLAVQRTLSDPALGNHFTATTPALRQSCLGAADRGYLRRDPEVPHRYYATEKGWQALLDYEATFPAKVIQRRRRRLVEEQRQREYLEERLGF